MENNLEEKRCLHEERDRIEVAIVNEMLSKKTGHRERLDSEHRQKSLVDRYMRCSKELLNLYQKPAHIVEANNSDTNSTISNAFNDFYLTIKNIKELNKKHSHEQVVTLASEFEELEASRQIAMGIKLQNQQQKVAPAGEENDDDPPSLTNGELVKDEDDDYDERDREEEIKRLTKGLPSTDLVEVVDMPIQPAAQPVIRMEKFVEFTDEEGYGRYLDLTKCHEAYLQVIKKLENKPNYLAFLNTFDRFKEIDREYKLTSAYKRYIESLLDYFRDYCRRAKPLVDYQNMEFTVQERFVEDWNSKKVPGWFSAAERLEHGTGNLGEPQIDLNSYQSHDELMELGLECLKKELQVRGLKCGGTLEERAKRLWSVKGKLEEEINDSLRAAPAINKKGKKRSTIEPFTIASIEAKLIMYADYFNDHRVATIENVQRKQARTAEERDDSDEDISDVEEEDVDQSDVVYNPKNLPLGWDGKPIPYWLYKLHGLNQTFTCEICGNATYKGPKTFQRHFAEWRHAHGMRCLGIPNSAHFANITKIEDVVKLWDKLKNEKHKVKGQLQNEEEYEDSQGNVVNKKTYEDLKRQGLL